MAMGPIRPPGDKKLSILVGHLGGRPLGHYIKSILKDWKEVSKEDK